jgi:hypothetical protein
MDAKTKKAVLIGISVAVIAPLIVDEIRKYRNKDKYNTPSNTDHSFVNWVGDDDFFEIEGDRSVETNPYMSLAPLTSRDAMLNFPEFKKYKPFVVTPPKKIKFV